MTITGGDPFIKIPNNAVLALLVAIPAVGRVYPMTIEVSATVPADWPTSGWVTVDQEIFRYTGVSGASLTGCRGEQQDSAAITHAVGARVGLYYTRDTYWPVIDSVSALAVYADTVPVALTVRVKPGRLVCGSLAANYEDDKVIAVADNATTYIEAYLAADTVAYSINQVGWTGDYFPLATVTAAGGRITDITPYSGRGVDVGNQEHALYTYRDWHDATIFGALGFFPTGSGSVPLNVYLAKIYFDGPNLKAVNLYDIAIQQLGAMPRAGRVSLALYYSDDNGLNFTFLAGSQTNSIQLSMFAGTGLVTAAPAAPGFKIRSDRQNKRQWFLAFQYDLVTATEAWNMVGMQGINKTAGLAPARMYPVFNGGASGGIQMWPAEIAAPPATNYLLWGKVY